MALTRPTLASATALLLAALAFALPGGAAAQQRKDSVVLAMVLEPAPGLDPTMAAAAAPHAAALGEDCQALLAEVGYTQAEIRDLTSPAGPSSRG